MKLCLTIQCLLFVLHFPLWCMKDNTIALHTSDGKCSLDEWQLTESNTLHGIWISLKKPKNFTCSNFCSEEINLFKQMLTIKRQDSGECFFDTFTSQKRTILINAAGEYVYNKDEKNREVKKIES